MKNYVISLKKTPERLQQFIDRNSHIEFEVFDAIDGSTVQQVPNYRPGALGNAMSHIELWKMCATGNEVFTICEDDVFLHKNIKESLYNLEIINSFDFICWGWNFDCPITVSTIPFLSPIQIAFNQDSMRANKNRYLNNPVNYTFMRLHLFNGSFCYSINPAGAKQFLDLCYPLKSSITVEIPNGGSMTVQPSGLDMAMPLAYQHTKSVICFPPMALADNDHSTSLNRTDTQNV
jgi:GR25 family glycosyltransferase involved in LPS biosynthesis